VVRYNIPVVNYALHLLWWTN